MGTALKAGIPGALRKMGFYIRKSLKVGPVRLNLSKGGLGASIGVKGARVGITSKGQPYVHAGRGGLYFRQYSGAKGKQPAPAGAGNNLGILILVGLGLGLWVFVKIINFFAEYPLVFWGLIVVLAVGGIGFLWYFSSGRQMYKKIAEYKNLLKQYIDDKSNWGNIRGFIQDSRRSLGDATNDALFLAVEEEMYAYAIGKILDDFLIDNDELELLKIIENKFSISSIYINEKKKDFFDLYCLQAISDHDVSEAEVETIINLINNLGLERPPCKKAKTVKSMSPTT